LPKEVSSCHHTSTSERLSRLPLESRAWVADASIKISTMKLQRKKGGIYGEDNDYFSRIFNNDNKIESNFKTFNRFMDDNVLDLRRRYEGRGRCGK
jgi:hypothetical protein